jgi:hypothetical protein
MVVMSIFKSDLHVSGGVKLVLLAKASSLSEMMLCHARWIIIQSLILDRLHVCVM